MVLMFSKGDKLLCSNIDDYSDMYIEYNSIYECAKDFYLAPPINFDFSKVSILVKNKNGKLCARKYAWGRFKKIL